MTSKTEKEPNLFDDVAVSEKEIEKTEAAAAPAIADPKPRTKRQVKKKQADFGAAVSKKGVLSAVSGIVSGTVDANQVAVPVLRLSMVGWVGTAPLEVTADSIGDIRKVLDELEKQAS